MELELWPTGKVLQELSISKPTLNRWRHKKRSFPKPTRLDGHPRGPLWWVAQEVRDWKAGHIAAR